MSVRVQLKWWVPRPSWELLERRVLAKKGSTDLYAGFEAEQIADLWLAIEKADPDTLDLPTGTPPHTQKMNVSDTPLENQEKIEVHAGIHPETKERLSLAAAEYDVNPGVLIGYIIREYYETDGWGRSIEAVGSSVGVESDSEPTTRAGRLDLICNRLDAAGKLQGGEVLADDVREVIADVAGPTVVDGKNGYLLDVLDRIGYVHHPHVDHLYASETILDEQYGVKPDAPAIDRKPYSALSKDDRIEGIKHTLARTGAGMTVSEIHEKIFDGNGSKSYMRNLAHEVGASDGFEYKTTLSGSKKILRASDPSPKCHPGPERGQEPDQEPKQEPEQDRRKEIENEATHQMDVLSQAIPATDGGEDSPE